ncbi:MAG: hypothetical protein ACREUW_18795 [Burkholderiales bacterium]
MTNIVKKNSNQEVLEMIRNSRLSSREQAQAVAALDAADRLVNLILAAKSGLEQLKARFALQPSLKH